MNAGEFCAELRKRQMGNRHGFVCTPRDDRTPVVTNDPLIDLARNYDTDSLATGGVYFFPNERISSRGTVIAEYQSDLLVINYETGNVELVEGDTPDHVMYVAAVDSAHFLQAFVEVAAYYAAADFDEELYDNEIEKSRVATRSTELSGTNDSLGFFQALVGTD